MMLDVICGSSQFRISFFERNYFFLDYQSTGCYGTDKKKVKYVKFTVSLTHIKARSLCKQLGPLTMGMKIYIIYLTVFFFVLGATKVFHFNIIVIVWNLT